VLPPAAVKCVKTTIGVFMTCEEKEDHPFSRIRFYLIYAATQFQYNTA
jgi:hypothetical protein